MKLYFLGDSWCVLATIFSFWFGNFNNHFNISEILIIQISKDELRHIFKESVQQVLNEINVTQAKEDDQLVKIDEICDLLRVSRVTIHKWKKEGKIPFHRLSNRIFFKRSEVLESLKRIDLNKRHFTER